jgi:lantibiotic modifying enzyme
LLLRDEGPGGASGLGGLIYALVRVAGLIDAPELLPRARQVAALLTPAAIAADTRLDVAGGVAGAALGLLTLYTATGDRAILAQAVACGERLLATRQAGPTAGAAWATLDGALLSGFAHGAAGIAYALLRLAAATGDDRFHAAAAEALAYESALFDPAAGNWPDLRPAMANTDGSPAFMQSWCHGAPGIALARLGGLPWLDTATIRRDLDNGLATTQATDPAGDVDHLCCGTAGRSEILLAAGRALGRPALVHQAAGWMAAVTARAAQSGGYYLAPGLPPDARPPGLFQGQAGIGYTLLRLAYPDRLPCLLLWE